METATASYSWIAFALCFGAPGYISLLLPSDNAMDESRTGAGAGVTYRAAQAGFIYGICKAIFISVDNLVQHER
jgi:hypothetical protein